MRTRLLAIAAIAGAMAALIAARAQARSPLASPAAARLSSVNMKAIVADQRPAFREYIVRERVPQYTITERVIVGEVLPEAGVTYYDVPQTFG